jgi:prephenate dehydrogenase
MKQPVTFKEFAKSPYTAILFMALMAVGYLQYQNQNILLSTIQDLNDKVERAEELAKERQDQLIEHLQKAQSNEKE